MNAPSKGKKLNSAGFTLLEVVVAMVILTYGVLGVAGTTIYVVRQVSVAHLGVKRVAAIQSVVERVKAEGFDRMADGSASLGEYDLRWTSSAVDTRTKTLQVISTGPGLQTGASGPLIGPAAVDTFNYRIVRP